MGVSPAFHDPSKGETPVLQRAEASPSPQKSRAGKIDELIAG